MVRIRITYSSASLTNAMIQALSKNSLVVSPCFPKLNALVKFKLAVCMIFQSEVVKSYLSPKFKFWKHRFTISDSSAGGRSFMNLGTILEITGKYSPSGS